MGDYSEADLDHEDASPMIWLDSGVLSDGGRALICLLGGHQYVDNIRVDDESEDKTAFGQRLLLASEALVTRAKAGPEDPDASNLMTPLRHRRHEEAAVKDARDAETFYRDEIENFMYEGSDKSDEERVIVALRGWKSNEGAT